MNKFLNPLNNMKAGRAKARAYVDGGEVNMWGVKPEETFVGKLMAQSGKPLKEQLARRTTMDDPAMGFAGTTIGKVGLAKPIKIPKWPFKKESMMDTYKNTIDLVPIEWLKKLPGNRLRQTPEEVAALGQRIEKEGMDNPLIINVGAREKTAKLGEGNHRLAALEALGYTHIPARVSVGGSKGYGLIEDGYGNYFDDLTEATEKFYSQELRPSEVFKSLSKEQPHVRKSSGGAVHQRALGAKLFGR
jgi:hypothetical protein